MTAEVFSVEVGAKRLMQTADWYLRQLRAGKLPGHKIGRKWVLTESDVQAALDITFKPAVVAQPDPAGLSARSRRLLSNRKANDI